MFIQAGQSAPAPNAALGAVLLIIGTLLYFVPVIVAAIRRVRNLGSVAVVNFFLGWTLIGWVVALAMACRTRDPRTQPPVSRSAAG
jgi:uncharacterized membrane protein YhaH (DUF805 family)